MRLFCVVLSAQCMWLLCEVEGALAMLKILGVALKIKSFGR